MMCSADLPWSLPMWSILEAMSSGKTNTRRPWFAGGPRWAPTVPWFAGRRSAVTPSSGPVRSSHGTCPTTPWFMATRPGPEAGCAPAALGSNSTATGAAPNARPAARNTSNPDSRLPRLNYRGEEYVTTVSEKQIPLLDLRAQHKQIREEVLAEIVRVVDSQKFILGEEVQKLEEEIAAYSGTKYAVGCASGSDALYLALMAIGIESGDEVLTTPYTFFATAGAISRMGAVPVFVDVEEDTFNLDANQMADALASHPKVRALIPVHLFGGCADMEPICAMAAARGIAVIEDAAQSIGSEYKNRRAG